MWKKNNGNDILFPLSLRLLLLLLSLSRSVLYHPLGLGSWWMQSKCHQRYQDWLVRHHRHGTPMGRLPKRLLWTRHNQLHILWPWVGTRSHVYMVKSWRRIPVSWMAELLILTISSIISIRSRILLITFENGVKDGGIKKYLNGEQPRTNI